MKHIERINNKGRDYEYLINGNNIEGKDGLEEGVYSFEDKLITWTDKYGGTSVWVRPGI